MTGAVLDVQGLSVDLRTRSGPLHAVRDISFTIARGETLCLVGESGSGKSMTALALLNLLPRGARRRAARLALDGRDIAAFDERQMRDVRGRRIAMVFQDPMSALDPMFTVGTLLTAAVRAHRPASKAEAESAALEALASAGIEDPRRRFGEYPFQLSGGVSQRVMIAMALVNNPKVLIADEPTTALDVTVQAQILDRLRALIDERSMSIMLITHNLGVVASVADRMAVMYAGEVVESGSTREVLDQPQHPYTAGLLSAVPRLGSEATTLVPITGRVPQPSEFPEGCAFADRCGRVTDECRASHPALEVRAGVAVRCFHPVDLQG